MTMPTDEALLPYVGYEGLTATQIFRRYAGLHERKSLTTKLRNERRAIALQLERMARQGVIDRGEGDAEFHPVPIYKLKPPF